MSDTPAPAPDDPSDLSNSDSVAGRSVVDRRSGLQMPVAVDRRQGGPDRRDPAATDQSGLKRLRGPGRRRPEFNRAAEEGEFTSEQFLFVMAINAFKKANNKSFPTWTEVLEVIRRLGYRKTQPIDLNLPNVDDWTEPADAPAMPEPVDSDDEETDPDFPHAET
jgi:hypothetical protein